MIETGVVVLLLFFSLVVGATLLIKSRQKKRAKANLPQWIRALETACELSKDALVVVDRSRTVLYSNTAAARYIGNGSDGERKKIETLTFNFPEEEKSLGLEQLLHQHRLKRSSEPSIYNDVILGNDEESRVLLEIGTYREEEKGLYYDVLLLRDQSCERKLLQLHHVNPTTGLSNQFKAFGDITKLTAQESRRNRFALMMIELDNASYLRSMLGYAEMDNIITLCANALRELEKNHPLVSVYHLNYVNFMLLIRGPQNQDELYSLFRNFQLSVQETWKMRGKNEALSFSAGISVYPRHGTLYSLLNSAYGALADAQQRGTGQIVVAGESFEQQVDRELQLKSEIERALEDQEFHLYFQPIYDAGDQSLIGAEVLLRWHHPERGIIMPDVFIPVAERSGLIVEIGRYVIARALQHLSHWNTFDLPPLRLSVNLSLRELESPDFISNLTALLYKYDIGRCELKFEITEHTSMINPELTQARLREIRQLGIGIALDDFGTGYSSFAHLVEFSIETLKIDRGFVTDLSENLNHQHIVSTMIKLGHSLGMKVVAEGVESREDVILLRSMGVDYLQGFYFSRPIPKLEFQYLLTHS